MKHPAIDKETAENECGFFVKNNGNNRYNFGGILTGEEIRQAVSCGKIEIDPFDLANVNPNSYNLRIGNQIATIRPNMSETYMGSPEPNEDGSICSVSVSKTRRWIEIDLKEKVEYDTVQIPDDGIMLYPDVLYLVPTVEHIHTDYYEPIITGRSSMGRLGISVHQEAGFGDIGFSGNMTLQLKVTYPTLIYPYFQMAQIYFLTPHGEIKDLYHGKYQHTTGIAGSKVYQDFDKSK